MVSNNLLLSREVLALSELDPLEISRLLYSEWFDGGLSVVLNPTFDVMQNTVVWVTIVGLSAGCLL
jgi:hypothetical protein